MSVIIKTTNLTKMYGNQKSVDHLNMTVNQEEIYGFLGRNGAGKTTTIRMLLNLPKDKLRYSEGICSRTKKKF